VKLVLELEGEDLVVGELALTIAPGTVAQVQSRAVDDALAGPLAEKAELMRAVLEAAPSRFTRQLPGKDAEGRVRFSIRARAEGDRLVPAHPSNKRPKR